MKIYKDHQYLIFDFENGKTVKYDFAAQKSIGLSGRVVCNLSSQLRGLTVKELIDCCADKQYAKFLTFIRDCEDYPISNIGTMLSRVPYYARFEQIFSAGLNDIVGASFRYTINDIPKSLIKLCREHKIILSNEVLKFYKENSNGWQLAYNLNYISLTEENIFKILTCEKQEKVYTDVNTSHYEWVSTFNKLISKYNYTPKNLLMYIDRLKTYEALNDIPFVLSELQDYCNMMIQISPKFDKFPRHFLTTHKIAVRNYNRLKKEFNENKFAARINIEMEKTFDKYCFIYPKTTQDIKDEAVQMNNCVADYIDDVIEGQCDILFLRYKDTPDKSLVTIEVRDGRIIQALERFNDPLNADEAAVVDKWNKWYAAKIEREVMKNVS